MSADSSGRVSDRGLLVLTSLAAGEKHGYALMQDIHEFGQIQIGPGTLYGLLAKLEAAGFVESLPADERRRPYRITVLGASALRVQLAENERLAQVGLQRIGEYGK